MTIQMVVKMLGIATLIILGLMVLVQTNRFLSFAELEPVKPQGRSEIRTVVGGTLIGMGLAAILFPTPQVYKTLAITFIAITGVRAIFTLFDRSFSRSNLVEIIMGGVLAIFFYV